MASRGMSKSCVFVRVTYQNSDRTSNKKSAWSDIGYWGDELMIKILCIGAGLKIRSPTPASIP